MKKFVMVSACMLFVAAAFSQVKPAVQPPNDNDKKVYALAMKYGDYSAAVNAMYSLIAKNPDNLSYKDSLASLYFAMNASNQCIRVCEEILMLTPEDDRVLEMMAISTENTGDIPKAIAWYEKLFVKTKNVYHAYQLAVLQYSIKRMAESKLTTDLVINLAQDKDEINIYVNKDNSQKVLLKAAAYNLRGMIYKDLNDLVSASDNFSKALQLSPDFVLAKGNLASLTKAEEPKKAEPPVQTPEEKKEKKK